MKIDMISRKLAHAVSPIPPLPKGKGAAYTCVCPSLGRGGMGLYV